MNLPSMDSLFRFPPGLPLLLVGLVLLAGCESRQPPRVVQVQGADEWMSISPTWGLTFSPTAEGEPTHMLLRDGDLLFVGEDGTSVPILQSDIGSLQLDYDGTKVTLAGTVVTLETDSAQGWDWLSNATPAEMASLRMISTQGELTPEQISLLEETALQNPELNLTIEHEETLPQLLRLFDPVTLVLGDATIDEEREALLAQEENLKTLWISGDEVSDLSFLGQIPNLETLFLAGWDPDEIGPLPDSLPSLKSIIVVILEMEDLNSLGDQPHLEELTLFGCDLAEDSATLDLSALARHPKLETLCLRFCPAADLSALELLPHLNWLALPLSTTQEQLEQVVRTHPDLSVLELIEPEGISDLTPLTELRNLKALLVGSTAPPDPLFSLDNLEYLAVVVENDEAPSFGEDVLPILQAELPGAVVTRVDPLEFCLGSGFILLLIPMVGVAWWMIRRKRRSRRPVPQHG